jgi:hypothetical protein
MSETFRTSIDIEATPERVFDHFVQPELLVRWMGDVARLEAKDGGLFSVDINGVLICGHYVRHEYSRLVAMLVRRVGARHLAARNDKPENRPLHKAAPRVGISRRPPNLRVPLPTSDPQQNLL